MSKHIRISDDAEEGQYDNLFDPLIDTLRYYNFYTITTRHSPAVDDRIIMREMKYWTAMYNYAIVTRSFLYLGHNSTIINTPFAYHHKEILLNLLQEDGISMNDIEDADPYTLFEFADMAIHENHIIQ